MRNLKRQLREWRIAWIVAPSVTGFILLIRKIQKIAMYAKVLEISEVEGGSYIHFTFHPPSVKARLEQIFNSFAA